MTIIQKPNPPLVTAGLGFLIEKVASGDIQKIGSAIFIASLIIWSYLEITSGVNLFRKVLGGIIFVIIALRLFNQIN